MTVDVKTEALLWRFLLGLLITELPIVSYQLQQPTFDWRVLLVGLIGGLLAALEKYVAPQLADTLLPPAGDHGHVTIEGSTTSAPVAGSLAPVSPVVDPTATPGQP